MKTFNHIDELKPYYNKKTNTYVFNENVEFKFDLSVESDIKAGNIKAWNITAGDINAGDIKAEDINAQNIYAHDINAEDIIAGDIKAWDINAGNIKAWDINAGDIKAWDINAWNIKAGKIDYFAVCFAYNDIYCDLIKGRRENCKHFVLDGEIVINKKPTQRVTLELTDEQLVKVKEVLGIKEEGIK